MVNFAVDWAQWKGYMGGCCQTLRNLETMDTLLLLAFFFALINAIGFSRIADILFSLSSSIFGSSEYRAFQAKWQELRTLRAELLGVSAQDEFARWARLQRKVDQVQGEYDRLNTQRSRDAVSGRLKASLALRVLYYGVLAVAVGGKWRRGEEVALPVGVSGLVRGYLPSIVAERLVTPKGAISATLFFFVAQQAFGRIIGLLISAE